MSNDHHKQVIAPISIDVGAAHTGVFRAVYNRGDRIHDIAVLAGEVLTLDNNKHTLLMASRTAKRHMRRCFDRRKLSKRLLTLVLEHYFSFPVCEHSQALGFFINRRGFTFLEESYNSEALESFSESAWQELPEPVQKAFETKEAIKDNLDRFVSSDPDAIHNLHDQLFDHKIKPIRNSLFVLGVVENLQTAANSRSEKNKIKLSKTPAWVIDDLLSLGMDVLNQYRTEEHQVDLDAALSHIDETEAARWAQQLETIHSELKDKTNTPWKNVNPEKFDYEKNLRDLADEGKAISAHLSNLTYAVLRANDELKSGSRHRKKYFEEIRKDIENATSHSHQYMQRFAEDLQASQELDSVKLLHVIGHISNLELKPLRAYFNDKAHRKGDRWRPEILASVASRWFMKQWRVNEEKDGHEKYNQYFDLRDRWSQNKNKHDMVAFWLNTEPQWTIPPYQSHTNRRPPYCQSLVLNPGYMDRCYPNWQDWLKQLGTSAPDLSCVMRRDKVAGQLQPLANDKQLSLRQLQFLLDRSQKADPAKLNLIWSQQHRRQKGGDKTPQAERELQQYITDSKLNTGLKQDLLFESNGSFGHFINKYYQCRRKARDGRYFLHPAFSQSQSDSSTTGSPAHSKKRWDDKSKLLITCPHRPRQKRHQMTVDFAAIIGLTLAELEVRLDNSKEASIETLLQSIKGFKSNVESAAKEQKKLRGRLKMELQVEKNSNRNTHLVRLDNRISKLAVQLASLLWHELDEGERQKKATRFNTIFSFAQIHNIIFMDRSGFSKTCPVCSTDNANRMIDDKDGRALASRLPALSVRLIDGAVMRLLEFKAEEITKRHWLDIKPALTENGRDVCVPLILEQNRFEFEPSLNKLKGKKPDPKNKPDTETFDTKVARIRSASQGCCPYYGSALGNDGELDHIIPRASSYGMLNDEANLIYVSRDANRNRGNKEVHLNDLHRDYKTRLFGTESENSIRNWIYQNLTGSDSSAGVTRFVFGNYLSYVNLEEDQQTAFRHALFLSSDDPLRKRVIESLQNRNRTFVNGTQRYLAQIIADKLYHRARQAGVQTKLTFDYFEYPANPSHPKGVQNLRGALGIDKQAIQDDYSHHIDAHMAFLIAVDDHRDQGSLGVDFGDTASVWPFGDGDISAYMETRVSEDLVKSISLERNTTADKINHEITTNIFSTLKSLQLRYFSKQEAIGQSYRPLFFYKKQWYAGYPKKLKGNNYDPDRYARKLSKIDGSLAESIADNGTFYELVIDTDVIRVYTCRFENNAKQIDHAVHKLLGSRQPETNDEHEESHIKHVNFILAKCRIYTKKTPLLQAPNVIKNKKLQNHPSIEEWQRFDEGWRTISGGIENGKGVYIIGNDEVRLKWDEYCARFLKINKTENDVHHRKIRNRYSMITVGTSSGTVLQVNRSGKGIFQAVPVDNNELPKSLVPYIVRHSNNVSWPSHEAQNILGKELKPVSKANISIEVNQDDFLKSDLKLELDNLGCDVLSVRLENTKAIIKNFPIVIFKNALPHNEENSLDNSYKIALESAIEIGDNGVIRKGVVDSWFVPTSRDGRLKVSVVDDKYITLEIPYKSAAIKKLVTKLKHA